MLVGSATGLLAACGDGESSTGSGAGARVETVAPSDTSRFAKPSAIYEDVLTDLPRGGKLEIFMTDGVPASLNPLLDGTTVSVQSAYPAHDVLEHYDHNNVLRPSLAESVEVVSPTELRYTLHAGAKFHNGRPVQAKDVKDTFRWVLDPANKSVRATPFTGIEIVVEDDRTFIMRLPEPNAGIRAALTYLPIIPVETAKSQASHPVGCGPFVFKRLVRDSYVEYERNPDYWNPEAPRVDELRISWFAEKQSAAEAFMARRGDYISSVPIAQASRFRATSSEFKSDELIGGTVFLAINHTKKPWSDARVRRAVALCFDRANMAATAFNGISTPYYSVVVGPDSPYYTDKVEYEQNIEEAKRLLAEAGYPDGFDAGDIDVVTGDTNEALATVARSDLAAIGVKVEVKVRDIPTYLDMISKKSYGLFVTGWGLRGDPSDQFDVLFRTKGSINFFGYSNPEVDRLLTAAKRTYDESKRAKHYQQVLEKIFVEDTAVVPLTGEAVLYAYRPDTNGDQYTPSPIPQYHWPIAATGIAA